MDDATNTRGTANPLVVVSCALVGALAAPLAWLFFCAFLTDLLEKTGAFMRSDASIPASKQYNGVFVTLFVIMPLMAIWGGIAGGVAVSMKSNTRKNAAHTAHIAGLVIGGLLLLTIPNLVEATWQGRALVAPGLSAFWANLLVWTVALSAPLLALLLGLWGWRNRNRE